MRFMDLSDNSEQEVTTSKTEQWLAHYIRTGDPLISVDLAEYNYKTTKARTAIAHQQLAKHADAILDATKKHVARLAPQAINVLSELMMDSEQAGSNRITAAKAVASYSGLDVQRTLDETPKDSRSDSELQSELISLINSGSMPPELMQAFRIATNQTKGAEIIPMKANG